MRNGLVVDLSNQYVVPYSKELLLALNAHINVEICCSVQSVKFLYKYIYKGHTHTTIEIELDEIKTFIDTRYISAPEAYDRIVGNSMHGHSPTVVRLAVLLEDKESVVFFDDEDAAEILDLVKRTTLDGWIEANRTIPETHYVLYVDFPAKFVWVESAQRWAKRQRSYAIERMYTTNPSKGERFYL